MTTESNQAIPTAPMNMRTLIELREHAFERALLLNFLGQAQAEGDRTFSIHRHANLTVRREPETLLDEIAGTPGWNVLRVYARTLTFRGVNVFGIVEAAGSLDRCLVDIQIWSDSTERAERTREGILSGLSAFELPNRAYSLQWRFVDGQNNVRRATTEELAVESLVDEAYPALAQPIAAFIETYLRAPEAVLLLQGPPGTGKTRLIKAILGELSRRRGDVAEVLFTGEGDVLENDEIFLEFITDSAAAFVVEDADHLLTPRAHGNRSLHRFLNIADGIASAQGKKIIFSTNLPNVRDIDDALIRPGRCFAHLHLGELSQAQAMCLFDRIRTEPVDTQLVDHEFSQKRSYSVAEIYAKARRNDAARDRSQPHAQIPYKGQPVSA